MPVALSRVAVQEGAWVADQVEAQGPVLLAGWVRAASDPAPAWALAGPVRVAAWVQGRVEVADDS